MTTAELHRRTVAERDWLDHLNSSPKDVEIEEPSDEELLELEKSLDISGFFLDTDLDICYN